MRKIFLDTSGLIAVSTATDRRHEAAAREMARLRTANIQFVLHEGIQVELLDTLSSVRARGQALRLLQSLSAAQEAGELLVHPLDSGFIRQGVNLFSSRPDKEWGLTDCISFVLMEQEGITEAFTADHHFSQAGYVRLIMSD